MAPISLRTELEKKCRQEMESRQNCQIEDIFPQVFQSLKDSLTCDACGEVPKPGERYLCKKGHHYCNACYPHLLQGNGNCTVLVPSPQDDQAQQTTQCQATVKHYPIGADNVYELLHEKYLFWIQCLPLDCRWKLTAAMMKEHEEQEKFRQEIKVNEQEIKVNEQDTSEKVNLQEPLPPSKDVRKKKKKMKKTKTAKLKATEQNTTDNEISTAQELSFSEKVDPEKIIQNGVESVTDGVVVVAPFSCHRCNYIVENIKDLIPHLILTHQIKAFNIGDALPGAKGTVHIPMENIEGNVPYYKIIRYRERHFLICMEFAVNGVACFYIKRFSNKDNEGGGTQPHFKYYLYCKDESESLILKCTKDCAKWSKTLEQILSDKLCLNLSDDMIAQLKSEKTDWDKDNQKMVKKERLVVHFKIYFGEKSLDHYFQYEQTPSMESMVEEEYTIFNDGGRGSTVRAFWDV